MKHPRVLAIALFGASAPLIVLGYWLALMCYIPSRDGCFATFDATRGVAMFIVAGLLILGGVMLLTTSRATRRRATDAR